jgi:hypothetical protein
VLSHALVARKETREQGEALGERLDEVRDEMGAGFSGLLSGATTRIELCTRSTLLLHARTRQVSSA